MNRPLYEASIAQQNEVYAAFVIDRVADAELDASTVCQAICQAFILGAGGYDGDFEAALTLEEGGLDLLLGYFGLDTLTSDSTQRVTPHSFKLAVRAAVDYGGSWDMLEDEISIEERVEHLAPDYGMVAGPLSSSYAHPYHST